MVASPSSPTSSPSFPRVTPGSLPQDLCTSCFCSWESGLGRSCLEVSTVTFTERLSQPSPPPLTSYLLVLKEQIVLCRCLIVRLPREGVSHEPGSQLWSQGGPWCLAHSRWSVLTRKQSRLGAGAGHRSPCGSLRVHPWISGSGCWCGPAPGARPGSSAWSWGRRQRAADRTGARRLPRERVWFMGPWTAGSTPNRDFRVVEEISKTTHRYILLAPGWLKEGFASLT